MDNILALGINSMTHQGGILLLPQRSLNSGGCSSQDGVFSSSEGRLFTLSEWKYILKSYLTLCNCKTQSAVAESFIKTLTFLAVKHLTSILSVCLELSSLGTETESAVGNPELGFGQFSENQHAKTKSGLMILAVMQFEWLYIQITCLLMPIFHFNQNL